MFGQVQNPNFAFYQTPLPQKIFMYPWFSHKSLVRPTCHAVQLERHAVRPTRHATNTPLGVANTATFTAFTSFLAIFEIFFKCFQLFQGQKNIFFKKCSKNGLVSKKQKIFLSLSRVGGSDLKVIKITFFLKPCLILLVHQTVKK